jgi:hypothetical protein
VKRCPGFLCLSFARWLPTELNRTARAAGLPLQQIAAVYCRCRILSATHAHGSRCSISPRLH